MQKKSPFTVLSFLILFFFVLLFFSVPHKEHLQQNLQRSGHGFCTFNRSRDRCPSYFSWIQHDLSPWNQDGISRHNLVNRSKTMADFRVVIVDGKLYMERYRFCYQTRAEYTLWGLLMLLEQYPGQVPDVDIMFSCGDRPKVLKKSNRNKPPPALFAYCTTRNDHFDIVFPDWSFWGWPEVNIAPWNVEMERISSGASRTKWKDRKRAVYWKGNTFMGTVRPQLARCKSTNVIINHQDWEAEVKNNFSSSSLSAQCLYRYKVYVEGIGWSVSLKYILACGSTTLLIEPKYFEFFSRSLVPYLHFWPVKHTRRMCENIRYAVNRGKIYPLEAQEIGECGQMFLKEQLTLEYVYEYMLHLLQGYAKLLKFKPVALPGIEPMTLESELRWHEVTIPRATKQRKTICSL